MPWEPDWAAKVRVKSVRSWIGRLRSSAHHEVNSKVFDVVRVRRDAIALSTCWRRVVFE